MKNESSTTLPDYEGGGIVNLMASITAALGERRPPYPPLRVLPRQELSDARNVVLWVVDGLGHRQLQDARAEHLWADCRAAITTVFPSTTASAITAFYTGLAPQQHGLTGWYTYLREIGIVAAILPMRTRFGGYSLVEAGVRPSALFTATPVFDRIAARAWVICPDNIAHSPYNLHHSGSAQRLGVRGLGEMVHEIARIAQGGRDRRYVYAYTPDLDAAAHEHGVASAAWRECLSAIDTAYAELKQRLAGSGTLLIVTADHGLVDIGPERTIQLETHPELVSALTLPLCGEPRAAYCYLHPGAEGRFLDCLASTLGDRLAAHRSHDLYRQGWFGLGAPHPRLAERIGDYILLPRGRWAVKDWLATEKRYQHIGMHGGIDSDEMLVPLIVAQP